MFEDVTDNIFHIFFLTFRRPNNQSIGQGKIINRWIKTTIVAALVTENIESGGSPLKPNSFKAKEKKQSNKLLD